MNRILSFIPVLLLSSVWMNTLQEVPPIRNFVRVNNEFCTGAQPRLEHLEMLKADGVKAIINLRPPSEHTHQSKTKRPVFVLSHHQSTATERAPRR